MELRSFELPFIKSIDSYEVLIASFEQFNEWKANIIMKSGNLAVVDLRFVKDPSAWVSRQQVSQNGCSVIYDSVDQFPIYLDILRNEKPLFVNLYETPSATGARCLLRTGNEPVGESEKSSPQ
jgi:hypothetical protein